MNATPLQQSERIVSLDILRGFAILGIFIMNIQSMSMVGSAYLNPTAFADFTGLNKLVWILSYVLADSKFMSIFSILFGAGVILFTERLKAKGVKSLNLHYRRNLWLLVLGLLHAYLLWYGDILVAYSICALWVVFFRNKKPKTLFILAFVFILVPFIFNLFSGFSLPFMDEASKQELMKTWMPSQDVVAKELNAYRGSYSEQLGMRIPTAIWIQTFLFFMTFGWRITGLMLLGMGLYKTGVLSAEKTKKFYAKLSFWGLLIGFLLVITGLVFNLKHGFSMEYSFFIGSQYNYWGSILVALGYIGLIMLLLKSFKKGFLYKSLKAVGQMALSNYLLQTIIGTFIFYGFGLALFGQVERWQQLLIVFAMWVFQLFISPIWLKYFRFGPFEWLWRSLTYWEFQEMRRMSEKY